MPHQGNDPQNPPASDAAPSGTGAHPQGSVPRGPGAALGSPDAALVVSGLRRTFPAARGSFRDRRTGWHRERPEVLAVADVSLQARRGEVTALLGTNGAGKTTTLSCAQGLLRPSAGTVRLLGEDPWRAGPDLRARVGIMLQDGGLPQAVRPVALLRHVASMYARPAPVDQLVERLGIGSFDGTTIRRLSGGQRQRVALAAALVGRPEVLFLDEPSAGLDPVSRRVVFQLIREIRDAGTAVVLTTHLMDDAERLADEVHILDAGRVVAQGTVEELISEGRDTQRLVFSVERTGLDLEDLLPPRLRDHLELVESPHGTYELTGSLTPDHLAAMTERWQGQHLMPTHLELTPRTLEDLFLEISGDRPS